MIAVAGILLDHLRCPMGTEGMPRVTWILESGQRNVFQKAYQVQLSLEPSFAHPFADTGRVESAESANVALPFACPALTRIHLRVRVWTEDEESPWSTPSSFVTAMEKSAWRASFITAEHADDWFHSAGSYLRRSFSIQKPVREAFAASSALGLYQLYLNGEKVGDEAFLPGWTNYHKHLCYQIHEVTDCLQMGENVIGAHLGAGWYKGMMSFIHERCNYGTRTAFIAQLTIRYTDGTEETIVTDPSWIGASSPVTFSEIYDGERYDARLEQPGWDLPGFKPLMGEKLKPHSVEPRGDRLQNAYTREEKESLRKRAQAYAPRDTLWRHAGTVDWDQSVLTPQPGAMPRVEMCLPATVLTTPKGETVLDFGQNLTGHVRFTVDGKEGALAHLKCFETLDAEGNAYFDNLRGALAEIRYTCSGRGRVTFDENFSFQGFRYALIERWPEKVEAANFCACVIHSDMEETGTFTASEPLLNRLESNIEWSLRGNFLDIPTDCPQRDERMGWTGDAQIFCGTAAYLRNTWTFFRKWLRDIAREQTKEGGVPHMVPDLMQYYQVGDWLLSQGTHSAAAWADVAVILPWTMYLTYGDQSVLRDQFDSMRGWIDFMQAHAKDCIWSYRLQFGDWVALDAEEGSYHGATPDDLVCTAYFAYSTSLFVKTCRVLGKTAEAETYEALYRRIVRKFQDTWLDDDGVMRVQTQTAHILALHFGLVPEKGIPGTALGLVKLLQKNGGHLNTGFVGTPYFCEALSDNGYTKEAWDLLLKKDYPSWLYQVTKGATTIWEHWDGLKPDGTMWSPDMNSFNHYAYGAIGEWLYKTAAGIRPDENAPGFKHILFCPVTTDRLQHVRFALQSMYGRIESRWERNGNHILCEFTVPVNASCTITLEKGACHAESDLSFHADTNGRLTAEAGSGHYTAKYTLLND